MPNPLVGRNYQELGPRFPDMSEPYRKNLIQKATRLADEENIKLHEGVYIGVTGPTYETPAEYKYLRIIGGDAVGMSTVPEVIVAVHAGLDVLAFSIITDMCLPDALEVATLEKILKIASKKCAYFNRYMIFVQQCFNCVLVKVH
jgi:purine-nucleoside phosphorylase